METKEFIEMTNNIVRLLVNAAGQENYTSPNKEEIIGFGYYGND